MILARSLLQNAATFANNISCQMCNTFYVVNSTKRIKLCLSVCLSDMCDNDARMVRLCNNGENKAWFGNFKLQ